MCPSIVMDLVSGKGVAMSLSYLTTRALKGRCFWRREGGRRRREKTGAAGKKRRKRKTSN
jgi:hypothetical protein